MSTDPRRDAAIARLKAKRDFATNLVSFLVVNAILVLVWAIGDRGFFWPIFVIAFWGLGLVLHAWAVFGRPITEDDVQKEIDKGDGDVIA